MTSTDWGYASAFDVRLFYSHFLYSSSNLSGLEPNDFYPQGSADAAGAKILGGTSIGSLNRNQSVTVPLPAEHWQAVQAGYALAIFNRRSTATPDGVEYSREFTDANPPTLIISYDEPYSAATPLASLAVSATLSEGNVTLSGSGAAGGTNNGISAYEIEYRESSNGSAWGAWMPLSVVSTTATSLSTSVAPSATRGYYRQFRVRTRGTAGSAYYSAWKESTNSVRRNNAPTAPTTVTASPTVFESDAITVSWSGQSDPDGNFSHVEANYMLNETTWGYVGTFTGSSFVHSPSVSRGVRVRYRLRSVDAFGVVSDWKESNTVTRNQAPVAPASLSVSPSIYESGGIALSWPAGSDPDGNLARYYLEYAASANGSAWSAWTAWTNTTALSVTHSPTLERGSYIKYRIYAMDSLSVISGYRESAAVRRNRVPATPTVNYPTNGKTTYNQRPVISATVGAEPDGQTQTLQISVDSGSWASMGAAAAGGGTARYAIQTTLSIGNHTISVRAVDALGAAGSTVSVTITVASPAWTRSISAGTVIANATISHRADLNEMLERVNTARAFYNLSAVALSGVGAWASWKTNMWQFQNGVSEIYTATGRAAPAWNAVPDYPTASIITQIRNAITGA